MLTFGTQYHSITMLCRLLFAFVVITVAFSSCSINKEFMFKTPEDYVFDVPVIDSSTIEYRIQPNDIILFEVYTNEGAMMLEFTTSGVESSGYKLGVGFQYTVDSQGMVEFPVIGKKVITGMTVQEAQDFIEDSYEFQFNGPYVVLKVMNRRAILFTSPAGNGKVVDLTNEGISIIEVLALGGGPGNNGDVSDIKVIRKVDGKQQVYHIDLSTIDGIRYANMAVEAGDIIYVQQTRQLGGEIVQDIQPYFLLVSSITLALALLRVF
jgi:polysaccharide export outer membrane protein